MQYLRITDVVEKTKLSKSHIWELSKSGNFPIPINLSPRVTVWVESEVDNWMVEQQKISKNKSNYIHK